MFKRSIAILLALVFLLPAIPSAAQTQTPPSGPVYIVQPGDTLYDIAIRFDTSIAEIMAVNSMTGSDIYVGTQLIIPGLDGLSGFLVTKPVPFGETLRSLSRQYNVDMALLIRLNHIVSPEELYAGYNLILLQENETPTSLTRLSLKAGETMLELAASQNTDVWTVASRNGLSGTQTSLPGELLAFPSGIPGDTPAGLPTLINALQVDPLPLTQGATVQIKVSSTSPMLFGGSLLDHALNFFQDSENSQVALQGVHAQTEPGLYPLRLDITSPDGMKQSFEQMVLVQAVAHRSEAFNVDASTIDPAVTGPEQEWLLGLVTPVTPEKYWQGMFTLPVAADTYCLRSGYGNSRSYNGGALLSFHTGLDFGVCSGTYPFDIYAPADGVVVYTGTQTVRGNATIIDHGFGVYSGMYHQEEIYVNIGDHVTAGQLIGKIGATGRVTGPHLHWDLFVNGIQVDPVAWLNETFPH